ncbi:chromosome segregation protein [Carpediemonas membranifera]|uniref:Chromosome segregation protein n=1 Tax=Carpediemonas membranifera TaxID=201153 RepID=A0A8J6E471_9EUKA|nr:chromosome segregation protein [Carpediemonas membranifera]|eukprot:KAG9396848.1 chromosome segregation protein [Carpediemonas membranifera]
MASVEAILKELEKYEEYNRASKEAQKNAISERQREKAGLEEDEQLRERFAKEMEVLENENRKIRSMRKKEQTAINEVTVRMSELRKEKNRVDMALNAARTEAELLAKKHERSLAESTKEREKVVALEERLAAIQKESQAIADKRKTEMREMQRWVKDAAAEIDERMQLICIQHKQRHHMESASVLRGLEADIDRQMAETQRKLG